MAKRRSSFPSLGVFIIAFFILVGLVAIVFTYRATTTSTDTRSRASSAGTVYSRWNFDTDGDKEGWVVGGSNASSVTDGHLQFSMEAGQQSIELTRETLYGLPLNTQGRAVTIRISGQAVAPAVQGIQISAQAGGSQSPFWFQYIPENLRNFLELLYVWIFVFQRPSDMAHLLDGIFEGNTQQCEQEGPAYALHPSTTVCYEFPNPCQVPDEWTEVVSCDDQTPISTPTPTCTPRPACLDANPPCAIAETSDMCPPGQLTPTPTPSSQIGVPQNLKVTQIEHTSDDSIKNVHVMWDPVQDVSQYALYTTAGGNNYQFDRVVDTNLVELNIPVSSTFYYVIAGRVGNQEGPKSEILTIDIVQLLEEHPELIMNTPTPTPATTAPHILIRPIIVGADANTLPVVTVPMDGAVHDVELMLPEGTIDSLGLEIYKSPQMLAQTQDGSLVFNIAIDSIIVTVQAIGDPRDSITPTPTPPAGCHYQQVQCVQAPCDPILVCQTSTPTPTPANTISGCVVTGCSGQICADEQVASTCEYRTEYACFQHARCERQSDGQCGWTETEAYASCVANAGAL